MKPHPLPASELARGRYVPGQVIINFLLKGAASPFDRVEKQVMKFNIGEGRGRGGAVPLVLLFTLDCKCLTNIRK